MSILNTINGFNLFSNIIKVFSIIYFNYIGILGSLIPVIITVYGYILVYDHFGGSIYYGMVKLVKPFNFVFIVALILVGIGCLVGMVGSYRAVRKHLKI